MSKQSTSLSPASLASASAPPTPPAGGGGGRAPAPGPGGGPGEHGQRGVRAGVGGVGEAAGGLHDLRLTHAEGAGVAREGAEGGGRQRGERGGEHGGGGALVLAERADELAGERDVRVGQDLGEQRAEQQLVGG